MDDVKMAKTETLAVWESCHPFSFRPVLQTVSSASSLVGFPLDSATDIPFHLPLPVSISPETTLTLVSVCHRHLWHKFQCSISAAARHRFLRGPSRDSLSPLLWVPGSQHPSFSHFVLYYGGSSCSLQDSSLVSFMLSSSFSSPALMLPIPSVTFPLMKCILWFPVFWLDICSHL